MSTEKSSSEAPFSLPRSATPQLLTRSAVPLLSQGLDASDTLECYALIRAAPLLNSRMPDATISVHKVAIGLRYRPSSANEVAEEASKVREITLEYGPQRVGGSLEQESTPMVQHDIGAPGPPWVGTNNTQAFVTWENEGKVYYTTSIASTGYANGFYMTSVTGAVLARILEKAVEYPMQNAMSRGRPRRYQPFVVVDGSAPPPPPPGYEGEIPDQAKTLIKSSGSSDFVRYMWETLADLGVSLQPILPPPSYQLQLMATQVEKIPVGPPTWVTQSAAQFYLNLYQCMQAIATGDYSAYASPTPAPSVPASSTQPTTQTIPSDTSTNMTMETKDTINNGDMNDTIGSDTGENGAAEQDAGQDDNGTRQRHLRGEFRDLIENVTSSPMVDLDENDTATSFPSAALPAHLENTTILNVTSMPTMNSSMPTSTPTISSAPSSAPTVRKNPKDTKKEVEQAHQAADEAKQAAAEAKDAAKTEVDSKAATAAEAAANAAQKAADATSNAAAKTASQSLLNGDGATMISAISPCFADPTYGIATQDDNGTITTTAYLYLDGSSYYKLTLVEPYMQVIQVDERIPQPSKPGGGAGGDFVDWVLAMMLLAFSLFGVILLIQQVCGTNCMLIPPLSKFQRWFFEPRHYKDKKDDEDLLGKAHGRGHEHNFGQDAIPLSMGGRRVGVPPSVGSRGSHESWHDEDDYDDDDDSPEKEFIPLNSSREYDDSGLEMGGIELVKAHARPLPSKLDFGARSHSSVGSAGSFDVNVSREDSIGSGTGMEGAHPRFARHPDLVELPNLKSSSKVAMPVGVQAARMNSTGSGSSAGSVS